MIVPGVRRRRLAGIALVLVGSVSGVLSLPAPARAGQGGARCGVAAARPVVAVRPVAPPGPHTYRPPVEAPVADPFRAPPEPWMPGNRGIEYRTVAGTVVRAIGPGVVVFAGRVAGELDVTIRHPDGLRSSYVDLATAGVGLGDAVAAGGVVGRSTDRLHLGVRRGSTYLDPASLWGASLAGRVVLVPDGSDRVDTSGPDRSGAVGSRPPALGPPVRSEVLAQDLAQVARSVASWPWPRAALVDLGDRAGRPLPSSVGPPPGGPSTTQPGSNPRSPPARTAGGASDPG